MILTDLGQLGAVLDVLPSGPRRAPRRRCGWCTRRGPRGTAAAAPRSGCSRRSPGRTSAVSISWRRSSKRSEMYLRKTRPRTTCLYSVGSWLPRSASAASQSRCSRVLVLVARVPRAMTAFYSPSCLIMSRALLFIRTILQFVCSIRQPSPGSHVPTAARSCPPGVRHRSLSSVLDQWRLVEFLPADEIAGMRSALPPRRSRQCAKVGLA